MTFRVVYKYLYYYSELEQSITVVLEVLSMSGVCDPPKNFKIM